MKTFPFLPPVSHMRTGKPLGCILMTVSLCATWATCWATKTGFADGVFCPWLPVRLLLETVLCLWGMVKGEGCQDCRWRTRRRWCRGFPDSLFSGSCTRSVPLPLSSAHAVQNQLGLGIWAVPSLCVVVCNSWCADSCVLCCLDFITFCFGLIYPHFCLHYYLLR